MTRTLRFSLDSVNANKKKQLRDLHREYVNAVNQYLTIMTNENKCILSNKEVKDLNSVLPINLKRCAYNKAVKVLKSWRKNKRKGNLPVYNGNVDLNSLLIVVQKSKNTSFDYCVRISTLNKGKRVVIPFKSYEYANRYFSDWELCKGGKIQFKDNRIYLILTFKKEAPPKKKEGKVVGIDIGIKKLMVDSDDNQYGKEIEEKMNKIQRKQQGSKAFKRALRERDEYINHVVKQLPWDKIRILVMENIKGIKKNTKKEKRLKKEFRSKFQRWTYTRLLSRVKQLAEVVGVQCRLIDPAYTSQTCSKCGFVHTLNRNGEVFKCRECGYTTDADYNASLNILKSYLVQEHMVPGSTQDLPVQMEVNHIRKPNSL